MVAVSPGTMSSLQREMVKNWPMLSELLWFLLIIEFPHGLYLGMCTLGEEVTQRR